ncbi:hypothetical protein TeGR_g7025, partial [Tetraparma gracilis]
TDGRTAINQAVPRIKEALQSRLLFLGKYDLVPGPPIHKSATCIVKKAFDEKAKVEYVELFKKYSGGTDSISRETFKKTVKQLGMSLSDQYFDERFASWDADKSGTITRDEFLAFCTSELDKGQKREVVFKFMKNEDQFKRELEARDNDGDSLDPRFIVGVTKSFEGDDFRAAVASIEELAEYKYAVLMPAADRNLDTIFRSERPDINAIRHLAQSTAAAVGHLHSKSLIHGDLKLLNVVRIMDRLCLIDLDASASIGDGDTKFFAGAKFSSGVAPPELIHKLKNKDERDQFASYFNSVITDDPELWTKIEPKVKKKGRLASHYVVKTFVTTVIGDGIEQPLDPHLLPYAPVESSAAFDMWSLGTVLFTLVTGSQLFKIKDIAASQRRASARGKEILETQEKLLAGQAQIIDMSKATQELVENSTSKLCKAIFEATEVSTPTCFIILPYELPVPGAKMSADDQTSMLVKAESWVGTVTDLVEEGQGLIEDPVSYAKNFLGSAFKSKMAEVKQGLVEEHLFLYLVDEYNGKPVYDESGVFPIKIETKSELVDKYMPMMRVGLQAAAVANGAASLANIFCPFVPRKLVPPSLLAKATSFVNGLDKPSNVADNSSVQKHVDAGDEGGEAKRGGELRDFEKFLQTHDPESSYAGLMRVCNEEDGTAIWTDIAKISALRAEIATLKAKKVEPTADLAAVLAEMDAAREASEAARAAEDAAFSRLKEELSTKAAAPVPTGSNEAIRAELASEAGRAAEDAAFFRPKEELSTKAAAPVPTGSNEAMRAEIARLKAELSEKDTALSELASQTLAFTEASRVQAGTLYKQSKYLKTWEKRTVTLDPMGNLTWDGGAGHKGFVTLREGDRVVPVNELDFVVEAGERKIAFRAGNLAEAGQWMQWIGRFVGGDTPLPPPPPL